MPTKGCKVGSIKTAMHICMLMPSVAPAFEYLKILDIVLAPPTRGRSPRQFIINLLAGGRAPTNRFDRQQRMQSGPPLQPIINFTIFASCAVIIYGRPQRPTVAIQSGPAQQRSLPDCCRWRHHAIDHYCC